CVLLIHGMNEHIGRYSEVARYFSQNFIVAGFDYYAHGLSNPILQQADLALMSGMDTQEISDAYLAQTLLHNLDLMRRDLDLALRRLIVFCDEQGKSGRPVFIVTHSLGETINTGRPDLPCSS